MPAFDAAYQASVDAYDALAKQADAALKRAQQVVDQAAATTKSMAMASVEALRGPVIESRVRTEYLSSIQSAPTNPRRQKILAAISFEEQVHENPPHIESWLEKHGYGDTVGPTQISVSTWSKHYGATREDLMDTSKHFEVANRHLEAVEKVAASRGMNADSIEVIGTLWNNHHATEVSDYGRRVEKFYNRFDSILSSPPPPPPPPPSTHPHLP